MLTLTLLRHAKSSWNDQTLDDFARPLSGRGEADAPRIGAYMRKHAIAPDLVLCSTARRTRGTLDLVLGDLGASPQVLTEDDLYLASAARLLALELDRLVREAHRCDVLLIDEEVRLVGHALDLVRGHQRHFGRAAER